MESPHVVKEGLVLLVVLIIAELVKSRENEFSGPVKHSLHSNIPCTWVSFCGIVIVENYISFNISFNQTQKLI